MKKANTSNISQTLTLVEQKVIAKAKRTLYLVLKRKGLEFITQTLLNYYFITQV